ncbi:MAG: hypothetical protein FHP94_03860 [Denitromonas halophila]|nr:MAG: hypothetical protein FHP94_03860 [Denitromonas halophila]TVT74881.1 MAG: hypothetical protein FHP93_02120 [Denitromonas halophila]
MNHFSIPFGLIFSLFVFVMIWRVIMRVLRRVSRMTDSVPADAGPALSRSGWGSAVINGARATNCVRVIEYASGHAVKMHPIFGGGLVWLPKSNTTQKLKGSAALLNHGKHAIQLTGKLAEFMNPTNRNTTAAAAHAHATHTHRADPDTDHSKATALATGVRRLPRHTGGSGLSRLAIWIAIALLVFVALRRTVPELIAPIEHIITELLRGV